MFSNIGAQLRRFDWVLFAAVLLLLCLSAAAMYSISLSHEIVDFELLKRQMMYAGIGLVFMFTLSFINYNAFRVYNRMVFVGTLILLILVLFVGSTMRGTTGWFSFMGFNFQPVELAKIALIIFLARFFSNRFQQFNEFKHIVISLGGVALLVGLIMLQPDMGSSLVLIGIWFMLLLVTGIRPRFILGLLAVLLVIISAAWMFYLQDYQKNRIMSFIHPELDPRGSGYNVSQAIIAIGSGQMFGRGLGFGSQSQLKFIPESQTDFVFAVIAEELGLFGVMLLLGLWATIFYRLVRAARLAHDDFGAYVVLGIASAFFIHVMVNIGMNMGILPVTGISLPFVSYGGSFLIMSLAMIGMAQSVIIRRRTVQIAAGDE
jgi:rod shape determining protein RodA